MPIPPKRPILRLPDHKKERERQEQRSKLLFEAVLKDALDG